MNTGSSCLCKTPTIEKSFRNSDIVFIGKVKSIKIENNGREGAMESERQTTVFIVTEIFEGRYTKTITTKIQTIGALCDGYKFKKNKKYLVYAKRKKFDYFDVEICSRTKPMKLVKQDEIEKLRRLKKESRTST